MNNTKEYKHQYYQNHKERICKQERGYNKRYRDKLRLECLIHYGGNPPKCACCGETHIEFLSIDHINGGGVKHREQLGKNHSIYKWLIENNFPEEFQILCHNCNMARGFYGYCPHEKEKELIKEEVFNPT